MNTHQTIKSIMSTYPGFQELPKGVRKMLLVSESYFFDDRPQLPESPLVESVVLVSAAVTAVRFHTSGQRQPSGHTGIGER